MGPAHGPTGAAAVVPSIRLPLTIVLGTLVVFAFASFVALDTASAHLASEQYYRDALDDAHAYDRVYDDLLADPGLQDEVIQLTGGIGVEPEDLATVVKQVAPPDYLRSALAPAIASVATYLNGQGPLELSLDATPAITSIHSVALDYAIASVVSLQPSAEGSFAAYQRDLKQALDDLAGTGLIPDSIPTFTLSDDEQDQAAITIFTAAGIDEASPGAEQVAAAVRASLAASDTASAVRIILPSLVDRLIRESIRDLTGGQYLVRVDEGGETSYLLEASPEASARVADSLSPFRRARDAAGAARPIALALVVLLLAAVGVLQLPRIGRALAVPGLVLVVAGLAVAGGWLFAKAPLRDRVADAAIDGAPGLPAAYENLVRDVIGTAADNLSGEIWLAAAVAIIVGLGLLIAGAMLRRPAWMSA